MQPEFKNLKYSLGRELLVLFSNISLGYNIEKTQSTKYYVRYFPPKVVFSSLKYIFYLKIKNILWVTLLWPWPWCPADPATPGSWQPASFSLLPPVNHVAIQISKYSSTVKMSIKVILLEQSWRCWLFSRSLLSFHVSSVWPTSRLTSRQHLPSVEGRCHTGQNLPHSHTPPPSFPFLVSC